MMKIQVVLLPFLLYWSTVSSNSDFGKSNSQVVNDISHVTASGDNVDRKTSSLKRDDLRRAPLVGAQKSCADANDLNFRQTGSVQTASSGTDWGGLFSHVGSKKEPSAREKRDTKDQGEVLGEWLQNGITLGKQIIDGTIKKMQALFGAVESETHGPIKKRHAELHAKGKVVQANGNKDLLDPLSEKDAEAEHAVRKRRSSSVDSGLSSDVLSFNRRGLNKVFKSDQATLAETINGGLAIQKILDHAEAETNAAKARYRKRYRSDLRNNDIDDWFIFGPSFSGNALARKVNDRTGASRYKNVARRPTKPRKVSLLDRRSQFDADHDKTIRRTTHTLQQSTSLMSNAARSRSHEVDDDHDDHLDLFKHHSGERLGERKAPMFKWKSGLSSENYHDLSLDDYSHKSKGTSTLMQQSPKDDDYALPKRQPIYGPVLGDFHTDDDNDLILHDDTLHRKHGIFHRNRMPDDDAELETDHDVSTAGNKFTLNQRHVGTHGLPKIKHENEHVLHKGLNFDFGNDFDHGFKGRKSQHGHEFNLHDTEFSGSKYKSRDIPNKFQHETPDFKNFDWSAEHGFANKEVPKETVTHDRHHFGTVKSSGEETHDDFTSHRVKQKPAIKDARTAVPRSRWKTNLEEDVQDIHLDKNTETHDSVFHRDEGKRGGLEFGNTKRTYKTWGRDGGGYNFENYLDLYGLRRSHGERKSGRAWNSAKDVDASVQVDAHAAAREDRGKHAWPPETSDSAQNGANRHGRVGIQGKSMPLSEARKHESREESGVLFNGDHDVRKYGTGPTASDISWDKHAGINDGDNNLGRLTSDEEHAGGIARNGLTLAGRRTGERIGIPSSDVQEAKDYDISLERGKGLLGKYAVERYGESTEKSEKDIGYKWQRTGSAYNDGDDIEDDDTKGDSRKKNRFGTIVGTSADGIESDRHSHAIGVLTEKHTGPNDYGDIDRFEKASKFKWMSSAETGTADNAVRSDSRKAKKSGTSISRGNTRDDEFSDLSDTLSRERAETNDNVSNGEDERRLTWSRLHDEHDGTSEKRKTKQHGKTKSKISWDYLGIDNEASIKDETFSKEKYYAEGKSLERETDTDSFTKAKALKKTNYEESSAAYDHHNIQDYRRFKHGINTISEKPDIGIHSGESIPDKHEDAPPASLPSDDLHAEEIESNDSGGRTNFSKGRASKTGSQDALRHSQSMERASSVEDVDLLNAKRGKNFSREKPEIHEARDNGEKSERSRELESARSESNYAVGRKQHEDDRWVEEEHGFGMSLDDIYSTDTRRRKYFIPTRRKDVDDGEHIFAWMVTPESEEGSGRESGHGSHSSGKIGDGEESSYDVEKKRKNTNAAGNKETVPADTDGGTIAKRRKGQKTGRLNHAIGSQETRKVAASATSTEEDAEFRKQYRYPWAKDDHLLQNVGEVHQNKYGNDIDHLIKETSAVRHYMHNTEEDVQDVKNSAAIRQQNEKTGAAKRKLSARFGDEDHEDMSSISDSPSRRRSDTHERIDYSKHAERDFTFTGSAEDKTGTSYARHEKLDHQLTGTKKSASNETPSFSVSPNKSGMSSDDQKTASTIGNKNSHRGTKKEGEFTTHDLDVGHAPDSLKNANARALARASVAKGSRDSSGASENANSTEKQNERGVTSHSTTDAESTIGRNFHTTDKTEHGASVPSNSESQHTGKAESTENVLRDPYETVGTESVDARGFAKSSALADASSKEHREKAALSGGSSKEYGTKAQLDEHAAKGLSEKHEDAHFGKNDRTIDKDDKTQNALSREQGYVTVAGAQSQEKALSGVAHESESAAGASASATSHTRWDGKKTSDIDGKTKNTEIGSNAEGDDVTKNRSGVHGSTSAVDGAAGNNDAKINKSANGIDKHRSTEYVASANEVERNHGAKKTHGSKGGKSHEESNVNGIRKIANVGQTDRESKLKKLHSILAASDVEGENSGANKEHTNLISKTRPLARDSNNSNIFRQKSNVDKHHLTEIGPKEILKDALSKDHANAASAVAKVQATSAVTSSKEIGKSDKNSEVHGKQTTKEQLDAAHESDTRAFANVQITAGARGGDGSHEVLGVSHDATAVETTTGKTGTGGLNGLHSQKADVSQTNDGISKVLDSYGTGHDVEAGKGRSKLDKFGVNGEATAVKITEGEEKTGGSKKKHSQIVDSSQTNGGISTWLVSHEAGRGTEASEGGSKQDKLKNEHKSNAIASADPNAITTADISEGNQLFSSANGDSTGESRKNFRSDESTIAETDATENANNKKETRGSSVMSGEKRSMTSQESSSAKSISKEKDASAIPSNEGAIGVTGAKGKATRNGLRNGDASKKVLGTEGSHKSTNRKSKDHATQTGEHEGVVSGFDKGHASSDASVMANAQAVSIANSDGKVADALSPKSNIGSLEEDKNKHMVTELKKNNDDTSLTSASSRNGSEATNHWESSDHTGSESDKFSRYHDGRKSKDNKHHIGNHLNGNEQLDLSKKAHDRTSVNSHGSQGISASLLAHSKEDLYGQRDKTNTHSLNEHDRREHSSFNSLGGTNENKEGHQRDLLLNGNGKSVADGHKSGKHINGNGLGNLALPETDSTILLDNISNAQNKGHVENRGRDKSLLQDSREVNENRYDNEAGNIKLRMADIFETTHNARDRDDEDTGDNRSATFNERVKSGAELTSDENKNRNPVFDISSPHKNLIKSKKNSDSADGFSSNVRFIEAFKDGNVPTEGTLQKRGKHFSEQKKPNGENDNISRLLGQSAAQNENISIQNSAALSSHEKTSSERKSNENREELGIVTTPEENVKQTNVNKWIHDDGQEGPRAGRHDLLSDDRSMSDVHLINPNGKSGTVHTSDENILNAGHSTSKASASADSRSVASNEGYYAENRDTSGAHDNANNHVSPPTAKELTKHELNKGDALNTFANVNNFAKGHGPGSTLNPLDKKNTDDAITRATADASANSREGLHETRREGKSPTLKGDGTELGLYGADHGPRESIPPRKGLPDKHSITGIPKLQGDDFLNKDENKHHISAAVAGVDDKSAMNKDSDKDAYDKDKHGTSTSLAGINHKNGIDKDARKEQKIPSISTEADSYSTAVSDSSHFMQDAILPTDHHRDHVLPNWLSDIKGYEQTEPGVTSSVSGSLVEDNKPFATEDQSKASANSKEHNKRKHEIHDDVHEPQPKFDKTKSASKDLDAHKEKSSGNASKADKHTHDIFASLSGINDEHRIHKNTGKGYASGSTAAGADSTSTSVTDSWHSKEYKGPPNDDTREHVLPNWSSPKFANSKEVDKPSDFKHYGKAELGTADDTWQSLGTDSKASGNLKEQGKRKHEAHGEVRRPTSTFSKNKFETEDFNTYKGHFGNILENGEHDISTSSAGVNDENVINEDARKHHIISSSAAGGYSTSTVISDSAHSKEHKVASIDQTREHASSEQIDKPADLKQYENAKPGVANQVLQSPLKENKSTSTEDQSKATGDSQERRKEKLEVDEAHGSSSTFDKNKSESEYFHRHKKESTESASKHDKNRHATSTSFVGSNDENAIDKKARKGHQISPISTEGDSNSAAVSDLSHFMQDADFPTDHNREHVLSNWLSTKVASFEQINNEADLKQYEKAQYGVGSDVLQSLLKDNKSASIEDQSKASGDSKERKKPSLGVHEANGSSSTFDKNEFNSEDLHNHKEESIESASNSNKDKHETSNSLARVHDKNAIDKDARKGHKIPSILAEADSTSTDVSASSHFMNDAILPTDHNRHHVLPNWLSPNVANSEVINKPADSKRYEETNPGVASDVLQSPLKGNKSTSAEDKSKTSGDSKERKNGRLEVNKSNSEELYNHKKESIESASKNDKDKHGTLADINGKNTIDKDARKSDGILSVSTKTDSISSAVSDSSHFMEDAISPTDHNRHHVLPNLLSPNVATSEQINKPTDLNRYEKTKVGIANDAPHSPQKDNPAASTEHQSKASGDLKERKEEKLEVNEVHGSSSTFDKNKSKSEDLDSHRKEYTESASTNDKDQQGTSTSLDSRNENAIDKDAQKGHQISSISTEANSTSTAVSDSSDFMEDVILPTDHHKEHVLPNWLSASVANSKQIEKPTDLKSKPGIASNVPESHVGGNKSAATEDQKEASVNSKEENSGKHEASDNVHGSTPVLDESASEDLYADEKEASEGSSNSVSDDGLSSSSEGENLIRRRPEGSASTTGQDSTQNENGPVYVPHAITTIATVLWNSDLGKGDEGNASAATVDDLRPLEITARMGDAGADSNPSDTPFEASAIATSGARANAINEKDTYSTEEHRNGDGASALHSRDRKTGEREFDVREPGKDGKPGTAVGSNNDNTSSNERNGGRSETSDVLSSVGRFDRHENNVIYGQHEHAGATTGSLSDSNIVHGKTNKEFYQGALDYQSPNAFASDGARATSAGDRLPEHGNGFTEDLDTSARKYGHLSRKEVQREKTLKESGTSNDDSSFSNVFAKAASEASSTATSEDSSHMKKHKHRDFDIGESQANVMSAAPSNSKFRNVGEYEHVPSESGSWTGPDQSSATAGALAVASGSSQRKDSPASASGRSQRNGSLAPISALAEGNRDVNINNSGSRTSDGPHREKSISNSELRNKDGFGQKSGRYNLKIDHDFRNNEGLSDGTPFGLESKAGTPSGLSSASSKTFTEFGGAKGKGLHSAEKQAGSSGFATSETNINGNKMSKRVKSGTFENSFAASEASATASETSASATARKASATASAQTSSVRHKSEKYGDRLDMPETVQEERDKNISKDRGQKKEISEIKSHKLDLQNDSSKDRSKGSKILNDGTGTGNFEENGRKDNLDAAALSDSWKFGEPKRKGLHIADDESSTRASVLSRLKADEVGTYERKMSNVPKNQGSEASASSFGMTNSNVGELQKDSDILAKASLLTKSDKRFNSIKNIDSLFKLNIIQKYPLVGKVTHESLNKKGSKEFDSMSLAKLKPNLNSRGKYNDKSLRSFENRLSKASTSAEASSRFNSGNLQKNRDVSGTASLVGKNIRNLKKWKHGRKAAKSKSRAKNANYRHDKRGSITKSSSETSGAFSDSKADASAMTNSHAIILGSGVLTNKNKSEKYGRENNYIAKGQSSAISSELLKSAAEEKEAGEHVAEKLLEGQPSQSSASAAAPASARNGNPEKVSNTFPGTPSVDTIDANANGEAADRISHGRNQIEKSSEFEPRICKGGKCTGRDNRKSKGSDGGAALNDGVITGNEKMDNGNGKELVGVQSSAVASALSKSESKDGKIKNRLSEASAPASAQTAATGDNSKLESIVLSKNKYISGVTGLHGIGGIEHKMYKINKDEASGSPAVLNNHLLIESKRGKEEASVPTKAKGVSELSKETDIPEKLSSAKASARGKASGGIARVREGKDPSDANASGDEDVRGGLIRGRKTERDKSLHGGVVRTDGAKDLNNNSDTGALADDDTTVDSGVKNDHGESLFASKSGKPARFGENKRGGIYGTGGQSGSSAISKAKDEANFAGEGSKEKYTGRIMDGGVDQASKLASGSAMPLAGDARKSKSKGSTQKFQKNSNIADSANTAPVANSHADENKNNAVLTRKGLPSISRSSKLEKDRKYKTLPADTYGTVRTNAPNDINIDTKYPEVNSNGISTGDEDSSANGSSRENPSISVVRDKSKQNVAAGSSDQGRAAPDFGKKSLRNNEITAGRGIYNGKDRIKDKLTTVAGTGSISNSHERRGDRTTSQHDDDSRITDKGTPGNVYSNSRIGHDASTGTTSTLPLRLNARKYPLPLGKKSSAVNKPEPSLWKAKGNEGNGRRGENNNSSKSRNNKDNDVKSRAQTQSKKEFETAEIILPRAKIIANQYDYSTNFGHDKAKRKGLNKEEANGSQHGTPSFDKPSSIPSNTDSPYKIPDDKLNLVSRLASPRVQPSKENIHAGTSNPDQLHNPKKPPHLHPPDFAVPHFGKLPDKNVKNTVGKSRKQGIKPTHKGSPLVPGATKSLNPLVDKDKPKSATHARTPPSAVDSTKNGPVDDIYTAPVASPSIQPPSRDAKNSKVSPQVRNERCPTTVDSAGTPCKTICSEMLDEIKTDIYIVKRMSKGPVKVTHMADDIPPLVTYGFVPREVYERIRNMIAENQIPYSKYPAIPVSTT